MFLRLLSQLFGGRKGNAARDLAPAEHAARPLQSAPASPEQWIRRGRALEEAGDLNAALACYRACGEAHPHAVNAHLAAAAVLAALWRNEECVDALGRAHALAPFALEVFSDYLLWNHLTAHPDANAVFELHRRFGETLSKLVPPAFAGLHRVERDPQRPLRIGYVSRNFLRHSVAFFAEPVIARHDSLRFQVYCYYTHTVVDETTERIAALADVWRHVAGDDDATLAQRIFDDAIDVLVDLGGHTKQNRLGVFARQPAPVQMTWMGYPDTTGVGGMDYRISDPVADPEPAAAAGHTERVLRLDPPFLCYRPADDSPPVTVRAREAPVVFGSFNMLAKVNTRSIDAWAKIMLAVPGSRLILKSSALANAQTAERVRRAFEACGIESARVELRGWEADRANHLAAYGEIDIALDTFPYNGTTTTCEALWMGVPVVALLGDMHMARVGATLLQAAGLGDLVAATPDEYVRFAVDLARDPSRRQVLREGMRARLEGSALLDRAGFTSRLEAAYRTAWRAWCAGTPGGDALGEGLRRGREFEQRGNLESALECYRACAAADPVALLPRLALVNALSSLWRMEEAIHAYGEARVMAPDDNQLQSGFLLVNHYAARPDAREIFELHRRNGQRIAGQLTPQAPKPDADPERPLRVGYVSRNFSRHSVGYFIEPVLAQHDAGRYEAYCYYTHPHSDETTARIAGLAHAWRHIPENDEALATAIRDDRIDVLVDLGGHTKLNSLQVFAQRQAPVQVSWLGYPDTTGLPTMDYRITDAVADPAPRAEAFHTECLLRLAPAFVCYQPPADAPAVSVRSSKGVVFASFNTLVKVNEVAIAAWSRILQASPGSRMLLKSNLLENRQAARRVAACFEAHGIPPERLDLRPWAAERAEHLAAYAEVDVALDTFPYTGTTTTCEALWMGVPVVTLAGEAHMSRVGKTLLGSVGLEDLVATDADDYVAIAAALAADPARRASLRAGMRARLEASPLLDHAAFTRRLEDALRRAWKEWCAVQTT